MRIETANILFPPFLFQETKLHKTVQIHFVYTEETDYLSSDYYSCTSSSSGAQLFEHPVHLEHSIHNNGGRDAQAKPVASAG